MPNALVISGGGSRGAFAVGAIEVLREAGITFDLISGTSTGALMAPLVATDEIQLLRTLYTSVRDDDIFRKRNVIEIALQDAIYDTTPLWRLINSFITPERYDKILASSTELYLTTVNLQEGTLVYWNPHTDGPEGGPLSRQAFMRAVLASASVPVLMPPIRIRKSGDQYVDGGVREVAPLNVAIRHGATDLYAIVLSPETTQRTDRTFRSVIKTLERTLYLFTEEVTFNDIERALFYNRAVRYIEHARAQAAAMLSDEQMEAIFDDLDDPFADVRVLNIHLIRPERKLPGSGLTFDPLVMSQMMELGRQAARRTLDEGPLPPAIA